MAVPAPSNVTTIPVTIVAASGSVETDLAQSSSGAAGAVAATLAAAAGVTNYLAGFTVDGLGATGASVIDVTITGLLGGTQIRKLSVPAGATVAITPLHVEFRTPWPASAVNTAIVVSAASFGAGNTQALVNAHGFSR